MAELESEGIILYNSMDGFFDNYMDTSHLGRKRQMTGIRYTEIR